jgi:Uma2 family endonuclease
MPRLYEDEGLEMGESTLHSLTCAILFFGLRLHFAERKGFHVFTNLNLHYSAQDPTLYVSPDVMVVKSPRRLPKDLSSYRIRHDGPAPCLAAEVLSHRTWQEGDMTTKPTVYAKIGIQEYVVVDPSGLLLPRKLVLLRRRRNGTWLDEHETDGGVTSRLGFRLRVDNHGNLRVYDLKTGESYPHPDEAGLRLREMKTAFQKEHALRRRLEAELARLRQKVSKPKQPGNGKRRHQ